MSVAEEEADCILRATTRRAARASTGNQAPCKAASLRRKQPQKGDTTSSRAAAGEASLREHKTNDTAISDTDTDTEINSNRAKTTCTDSESHDDLVHSTACSTPGPSRQMQLLQDDVEADGSDMDCAPTPVLPMTARRRGRFAAMQTLEVRPVFVDLH